MGVVPAELYNTLYLLLASICTVGILLKQKYTTNCTKTVGYFNPVYFLALFFTLFIGNRPESHVFIDMMSYINHWDWHIARDFGQETENFIYDHIPYIINSLGGVRRDFYILIAFIYFFGTAYAFARLFGNNAIIAYIVWLAAFSTFSYGTNGIKAGAAASIFIIAISYHNKKIISLLLLLICLGMHHSMKLPIGAYIVCHFIKNPKYYIILWILCLMLSALHITQIMEFIGEIISDSDSHGADYLLGEQTNIKKGFRPDFVIYSAVPIVLGYWIIIKENYKSKIYNFIWNIYTLCNALWLLCMYASYTNRIAYLSWSIYPLVLIYPFLFKRFILNQTTITKVIIAFHLLFTLFMMIVYYGN